MTKNTKPYLKEVLKAQKLEITVYKIYQKLAQRYSKNRAVLEQIAEQEYQHYEFWKGYTGQSVAPDHFKVFRFMLITRVLGLTFAARLLEKTEMNAQHSYQQLTQHIPEAAKIILEEKEHEQHLIDLIREDQLKYAGSVVLGMNDALVELTGALAGFTFALQQNQMIAMVGLITGIAASLSMAASEYLAVKTDNQDKQPLRSAVYTGLSYIITVFLLILPYLSGKNPYLSLATSLLIALGIIMVFNYYIAIIKATKFWKRFLEMASISLGVAVISFVIGYLVRHSFL